ncbi:MAG: CPBP family intramembrane metalloprotease [Flavobacteriaceae bacterium]|nr:CPBP family intramembrane metalloprotease [Flavobacteriaceae bacterium]|tara:strand:- start:22646 stop:23284 length:639 start_codon:yes stop_codon:yes gene_type:complete
MPTSARYRIIEFFVLFMLLPISLAIPYNIWAKVGLVLIGFVYVVIVLLRNENIRFQIKKDIPWALFWKRTALLFLCIIVLTTTYVYLVDKEALFFVPRTNLLLFLGIVLVYTLLSVWPQELIYRTFFFERYTDLFNNKRLMVFVNAIVFSLAHLFFRNTLVLVLTFFGGLLFGITYLKFKSTTLVTIEHALYGNWLFTVGMGQMLAFPGMES